MREWVTGLGVYINLMGKGATGSLQQSWIESSRLKLVFVALLFPAMLGCFSRQRYQHFQTTTPLSKGDTLVIGFLGGRERWNSPREGVRKLALELRALNRAGLHIETVENVRRELALRLVQNAFDFNADGRLQKEEKRGARLILYGQSFGGAAVVKFATQMNEREIPVLLTVQIDSVGRHDDVIPENVRFAANLFQRNGWFIRGEPVIRAADPKRTTILGNFEFDYKNKSIDLTGVPWYKKMFRVAHSRMNLDPEVWEKVKKMIIETTDEHR